MKVLEKRKVCHEEVFAGSICNYLFLWSYVFKCSKHDSIKYWKIPVSDIICKMIRKIAKLARKRK